MLVRYGQKIDAMGAWRHVPYRQDDKALEAAYSMACKELPPGTMVYLHSMHEVGHRGAATQRITAE